MSDIYDYHEHNDYIHRTTGFSHVHDRHPYHHHDVNGSIQYYNHDGPTVAVDNGRADAAWDRDPDDSDIDRQLAPLIGESGYDISHRTR